MSYYKTKLASDIDIPEASWICKNNYVLSRSMILKS